MVPTVFSKSEKSSEESNLCSIIDRLLWLHLWTENTAPGRSELKGDELELVLCGSVNSFCCMGQWRQEEMHRTTWELLFASLPIPSEKGLPSANTLNDPNYPLCLKQWASVALIPSSWCKKFCAHPAGSSSTSRDVPSMQIPNSALTHSVVPELYLPPIPLSDPALNHTNVLLPFPVPSLCSITACTYSRPLPTSAFPSSRCCLEAFLLFHATLCFPLCLSLNLDHKQWRENLFCSLHVEHRAYSWIQVQVVLIINIYQFLTGLQLWEKKIPLGTFFFWHL